MKEDALKFFKSPKDLKTFYRKLDIKNGWKLRKGKMNQRGKAIKDAPYTKKLRTMFRNKGFYTREVSSTEIVSWLDNIIFMLKILDQLSVLLSEEEYNNLEIFLEYRIKMAKMMRIDYVLKYKDSLLLLEFRVLGNFDRLRTTWQRKKAETLIYKELMQNYLNEKRYYTHAFIGLCEFDGLSPLPRQIGYNKDQIEYVSKYIVNFLYQKHLYYQ
ncbi:MAG: hypothetical protein K9L74_04665 [Candidatus Izimaplasma sp.]|nr:hypothetical protein [Candidatus Izimaplasma bacterium]